MVKEEPAERWLHDAIESDDEPVAAAVLASHGRAWIERVPIDPVLRLIRQAEEAFGISSRSGLWARYLLALDSALRLGEPASEWFSEDACSLAERTELGLLYRAEQAEFMRLRGDMAGACTGATIVLARLSNATIPGDSGATYVRATSQYVTANLLRQGGQYDLARQLITAAAEEYEPNVPAHRVELTHCMYARSVCDAMRGVAAVRTVNEWWGADEAVFARALVTLANSHAAWFVADYERAIQFAQRAHVEFTRIGYERYAARAERLVRLLNDWAWRAQRRTHRPDDETDDMVEALLGAPPGTRVTALAGERPSRALSVLQFTLTYGADPGAARTVDLPEYIAITATNGLVVVTPPPAASYREADIMLRTILGVGATAPVPLAVD
jgi:hypothetical protein